jgi:hypothetical protein
MHSDVGTATQLLLAQNAGDANVGIYSNFAPAVILGISAIIVLCLCIDIIQFGFEYIIWWIFFRGKDDDE